MTQVALDAHAEGTVLAIAARTDSGSPHSSSDMEKAYQFIGVKLYLEIDTVTGTSPTLDVKVQTKDPVSGEYHDLTGATFAQKTAAGRDELVIYPGKDEVANRAVNDALPRTWKVVATIGGTDTPTFTFGVGYAYLG